jgi:hypothetical protein
LERSTRRRGDLVKIERNIKEEKSPRFVEDDQGVLQYKGRICMPNVKELKDRILREAHESTYSIHPGGNKTYHDLQATYWWYGMKRDIAEYAAFLQHLSKSQGRASATRWNVSTLTSAHVKVQRDRYGFHHGIA